MKPVFRTLAASLWAVLFATASQADFSNALTAAKEGDWETATAIADPLGEIPRDVISWHRLRAGIGTFEEYLSFVKTKREWPGLVQLRRMGERKISPHTDTDDILAYFRNRHAATPHGALYLARALNKDGQYEDARAEIVLAWRLLPFSRSEQAIFQKEFGDLINPHNFARLDRFLWRGQHEQVEKMYPFLSPDQRALARARIALRKGDRGVDARIKAVTQSHRNDPGLAFERFLWRMNKGRRESAEKLIRTQSATAQSLGRPDFWSSSRRTLARDALRRGRAEVAYDIASRHHLTSGNDFADLEWISGFIALTRLDDPVLALRHFRRFRAGVESPISIGRAAYWQAQAYLALDRPDDARVSLEYGAEFQTGFYGLLASEAAEIEMHPAVYHAQPEPMNGEEFLTHPLLSAGLLLAHAGEKPRAAQFFSRLYDLLESDEQVRLGDLAVILNEPHIAVTLAKLAATRGDDLSRPYFPLVDVEHGPVPPELILSIIRRESEFNSAAKSHAGARGLMQLMPRTAREVSGQINEPYTQAALISDPEYNVRLGTEYLRQLDKQFGGNPLLIASAYNAGPSRTEGWIRKYGDPRNRKTDPIEWIESIPFRETRNYVMRVAESVVIYRARLAGGPLPIVLRNEIAQ